MTRFNEITCLIQQLNDRINCQLSSIITHSVYRDCWNYWQQLYLLTCNGYSPNNHKIRLYPWNDRASIEAALNSLSEQHIYQAGAFPCMLLCIDGSINISRVKKIPGTCILSGTGNHFKDNMLITQVAIVSWVQSGWFTHLQSPHAITHQLYHHYFKYQIPSNTHIKYRHFWMDDINPILEQLCTSYFFYTLRCLLRDKIGHTWQPTEVQQLLQHWLLQYCNFPLHSATVSFEAKPHIIFHIQLRYSHLHTSTTIHLSTGHQ